MSRIIGVNGHTAEEANRIGTLSYVSYNRMLPELAELVGLNGDEEIIGLNISDDGITVLIKTA